MGGDRVPRFRVGKGEAVGVEMVATIAGDGIGSGVGMGGQNGLTARRVEGITQEGMAHSSEMDADLVGAARGNRHIEQDPINATRHHLHTTFGGFAAGSGGVDSAEGGVGKFPDPIGDCEGVGVRPVGNEGAIGFRDRAIAHLLIQLHPCVGRSRPKHDPRCAPSEAMDRRDLRLDLFQLMQQGMV